MIWNGWQMNTYKERVPDNQYRERLAAILESGDVIKETPQGVGAITCFGTLPPMIFDLRNGAPLITERKIGFWKKPIAEIFAFINGARTQEELVRWGCEWWQDWTTSEKCAMIDVPSGDLGPGSYGAAFHDFPRGDIGGGFNQFAHLVEQLKNYPNIRTHLISPWIPYYIGRGGHQKAVVSPCHGWIHCRVINDRLDMIMTQRSADMPVGVPANMIQYSALLLALAHVIGYQPGRYIHELHDAHIYENQAEMVKELMNRKPRSFPTLELIDPPDDLFLFRPDNFAIRDYYPHPSMKIPVAI